MHVFSVDDSARVTHLGQYGYYYWARGSALDGVYEYIAADEDGLRVISIADPEHPVQVAFYDVPDQWANGVVVVGGYVYVAYGMAGLQVFQALSSIAEETTSDDRTEVNSWGSIVRGVLFMSASRDEGQGTRDELLDISGRTVLNLKPGANNVGQLVPGVYFVRQAQAQAQTQAVRKVIVSR
jgi:hypothetical protein